MEGQYAISFARGAMIRPGVTYIRGDADGDANSFNEFQGKVSFVYPHERWQFYGNIYLGWTDYDEVNPIFNECREDKTYGTTLGLGYASPFGCSKILSKRGQMKKVYLFKTF